MASEHAPLNVLRFGGLRLDLSPDEVSREEAIYSRDIDWDGSLGRLRPRDGFQKLKTGEATGEYKGLFAHSSTRLLAIKRISGTEVKIVAIDNEGAEKVEATWTKEITRPSFARFGTPSASYTYARGAISTHKVVRFDGSAFSEPTATVDGVAAKEMPKGLFMATSPSSFENRLVVANTAATGGPGGAASSASHVWFSDPGSAETWHTAVPEANYVQLTPGDGEEIVGMCVWGGLIFVFKQTKFFVFYGVGVDPEEGGPSFEYKEVTLGGGTHIKRPSIAALTESSDQQVVASPSGVYICASNGVYVTRGAEPQKLSMPLRPLEEASAFEGVMATFLEGTNETFRWPASGVAVLGDRVIVKRYEYLFILDLPTGAWTCWKQPAVSMAIWDGLSGANPASVTKQPGTLVDLEGVGVRSWTNPTNAKAIDGAVASSKMAKGGTGEGTHYLKGTNYGFAVPAKAIITGVKVLITRKALAAGWAGDKNVRLVVGGVIEGNDKGGAKGWSGEMTTASYGGPEDLWGLALTPAQVNGATFGVVHSAQESGSVPPTFEVDAMEIVVYYSEGESSTGLRSRLLTTLGKWIYWTGPSAKDDGGNSKPTWQSGFNDLEMADEKNPVETKVWGEGELTFSTYSDFSETPDSEAKLTMADTGGMAFDSNAQPSLTFSSFRITFPAAVGNLLWRVTRYIRNKRVAGTESK